MIVFMIYKSYKAAIWVIGCNDVVGHRKQVIEKAVYTLYFSCEVAIQVIQDMS